MLHKIKLTLVISIPKVCSVVFDIICIYNIPNNGNRITLVGQSIADNQTVRRIPRLQNEDNNHSPARCVELGSCFRKEAMAKSTQGISNNFNTNHISVL